jgi:hypothetical protein
MKHTIKNVLSLVLFLGISTFALVSCYTGYEGTYYHRYHHHHRDWYAAHHRPEPAGVNWSVDVDVR